MNVHDFKVKDSKGGIADLSQYDGKVLLIVNTATKCGLTPQYDQLEALYKKYRDRGLEILDFPSNQFLKQAPGTDEEIEEFCTLNYGTTFPRFSKVDVNGKDADPLFAWLKEQLPEAVFQERRHHVELRQVSHRPRRQSGGPLRPRLRTRKARSRYREAIGISDDGIAAGSRLGREGLHGKIAGSQLSK